MAKIFEYKAGSFIDQVSKTVMTPTDVTHRQTEKGVASIVGTNKYITQPTSMLPEGDFTVVVWSKLKPSFVVGTDRAGFISNTTTGLKAIMSSYNVIGGRPILSLSSSVYRVFDYVPDKNWHCYIFTFSNISTTTLKVDNINISPFDTSTGTEDARSSFVYVGGGNNSSANIEIAKIKVYNTVLSDTEQTKEYQQFLQASPTEKDIRGFEYPKPTDLSSEKESKLIDNNTISYDFTDGWTATDATINSATSFTANANHGRIYDGIGYSAGDKFQIRIKGSVSTGDLVIRDGTGGTGFVELQETLTGTFNTTFTKTISAIGNGTLVLQLSTSGAILNIEEFNVQKLTGLVAAYSFSPETVKGGVLNDMSGNANHGTISGALLTKEGMRFDGVKDYINLSASNLVDVTKPFTFCWRGNSNTLDGVILNSIATNNKFSIIYATSQIKAAIYDGATKGVASTSVINTETHDVVYTWDGTNGYLYVDGVKATGTDSIGFSAVIGTRMGSSPTPSSFHSGDMTDAKFYNYAFTPQQAKDYHNSFVKPVIVEDFSNYAVRDVSPKGWVKGTGSFIIGEDVNGKYLQCTSNGTIIIPADLDSFKDNGYIEIDRWDGLIWTTHKSTVDALKAQSWFDYSNKKITLTGTTGDRFANLKIYNGVKL